MVRYMFKKGYDRNTTWSANILRKPWGVSSFIRVFIAITCYNKGKSHIIKETAFLCGSFFIRHINVKK